MAAQLKQYAIAHIEKHSEELNKLGKEIWKNPELAYEEHKSHNLLTDYLESKVGSANQKIESHEFFLRLLQYAGCAKVFLKPPWNRIFCYFPYG